MRQMSCRLPDEDGCVIKAPSALSPTVQHVLHGVGVGPYLSYVRARRPDLFGQARRPGPGDLPDDLVAAAPELSAEALARMVADSSVLCVDTRGSLAYRIGHLPGSVNIPDDHLEDLLRHGNPFPRSRMAVFVCPAGEYSRRLAAFLCQAGYDAASLAGGVIAWRDAGLPLESGLTPGTLPAALAVSACAVHAGAVRIITGAGSIAATAVHAGTRITGTRRVLASRGRAHRWLLSVTVSPPVLPAKRTAA